MYPSTIHLVNRFVEYSVLQYLTLKSVSGSKTAGDTPVRPLDDSPEPAVKAVFLFKIRHRGKAISKSREQQSNNRRRLWLVSLRDRTARFLSCRSSEGWFPASLRRRVESTGNFTAKIRNLAPVGVLAAKTVGFDTQKIENPEISGVEYQLGTLHGSEIRKNLLEKWARKCVCCGQENVPLQAEHIVQKASGGSCCLANLALACPDGNRKKADQKLKIYLKLKPEAAEKIFKQVTASLKDVAAVNSTRWAVFNLLKDTVLPVFIGSVGQIKFSRPRFGIQNAHALDVACAGQVSGVSGWKKSTLIIFCQGRGAYKRSLVEGDGFPRGCQPRTKSVFELRNGGMVQAEVPKGQQAGIHPGRVAVRTSGSFNGLATVSNKYCRLIQRADGYGNFVSILN
jgi:hypothetical protein